MLEVGIQGNVICYVKKLPFSNTVSLMRHIGKNNMEREGVAIHEVLFEDPEQELVLEVLKGYYNKYKEKYILFIEGPERLVEVGTVVNVEVVRNVKDQEFFDDYMRHVTPYRGRPE